MYEVEATPDQIETLAGQLKPTGWYTHFWQGDDVTIVFPNKKFDIQSVNVVEKLQNDESGMEANGKSC